MNKKVKLDTHNNFNYDNDTTNNINIDSNISYKPQFSEEFDFKRKKSKRSQSQTIILNYEEDENGDNNYQISDKKNVKKITDIKLGRPQSQPLQPQQQPINVQFSKLHI